jgi:sugar phosphate isomerase/epimerase
VIHRELAMDLQFSTACLPRFSLRSGFATARALGLDSVQIALTPALYRLGPERLAREAERYGVAVRSLDLGTLGGVAMTREAIAGIAAFATALPECHVVALPAPRRAGQAPGGLNGYLAVVRAYGEALWGHATVTIVNAPGGNPGAAGPLDRFPQLRRIVEEWELGYTFDTSHAASAGWVITEPLPQMGSRLRNVHLGDFRQRSTGGGPEPATYLPDGVQLRQLHRAPGTGVLPLRAFLRALRRREYAGLVTIDLRESGLRAWWSPARHRQLVAAVAFCRDALASYRPLHSGQPGPPVEVENDGRRA